MVARSSAERVQTPLAPTESGSSLREPIVDRRSVNKALATVAATLVGGGGIAAFKLAGLGGGSKGPEIGAFGVGAADSGIDENDTSEVGEQANEVDVVVVRGIETGVDDLLESDGDYDNRPWARPDSQSDLTREQRKQNATISVTLETTPEGLSETITDEGIAVRIGQHLEAAANKWRSKEHYIEAQRGKMYTPELWTNYVRDEFVDPMIDGLFTVEYDEPEYAGCNEAMSDHLAGYAGNFESSLANEIWHQPKDGKSKSTLYVKTWLIEALASDMAERSLMIGIETRRIGLFDFDPDIVCDGEMIVNIDKRADEKYDMGCQYLWLRRP